MTESPTGSPPLCSPSQPSASRSQLESGADAGIPLRNVVLRCALWVVLGGWVGCWVFFGAVVAPSAFRVLPSTELAGRLVGPVLGALQVFGGVAGIALALLAWALGRGRTTVAIPALMAAVCLVSHFGISREIASIRDLAFGPEGNAEMAARFTWLHQLSVDLYIGVGIAALVLMALHTRCELRASQRDGFSPRPRAK